MTYVSVICAEARTGSELGSSASLLTPLGPGGENVCARILALIGHLIPATTNDSFLSILPGARR